MQQTLAYSGSKTVCIHMRAAFLTVLNFFFVGVISVVFFVLVCEAWCYNYHCNVQDMHILYRHINRCARVICALFTPCRVSHHLLYKWVAFSHHHCRWGVCVRIGEDWTKTAFEPGVWLSVFCCSSHVFNFFCIKQSCCPCTCCHSSLWHACGHVNIMYTIPVFFKCVFTIS